MKYLYMIILMVLVSCTSANSPEGKINEFVQMNEAWQVKHSKEEVVKSFGSNFKKVQEGIFYNYDKTSFTKMAFFFDRNKNLIDQYAIVEKRDLNTFKKRIPCKWIEKKTQLREAHVVRTVESGECSDQHVKYFYRKDLGLYEIRWF